MGGREPGVLRPVADAVRLVTRADATLRRQANLSLRAALVLAALDQGPRRVGAVARDAALSPPTASHVLERWRQRGSSCGRRPPMIAVPWRFSSPRRAGRAGRR